MADRSERGSSVPLIIGFTAVLLLVIAFVVDATAAYVRHSELDTLADGAALQAADAGATGTELYDLGLTDRPLQVTEGTARRAVDDYLDSTGARAAYPGLVVSVSVSGDGRDVAVWLSAPLRLPLGLPGAVRRPTIAATANAEVAPGE